jgi:cupin fold WbuC family metalloprotein
MYIIDNNFLNTLSDEARQAPRKRKNYNFHSTLDDPINRMLNAVEPDTYAPPHKHENPDKREVFIILRGSVVAFFFDDEGNITDKILLNKEKGVYGVEVPPGKWHSVMSLESGSVLYEIKDGPYNVQNDKIIAPWAPIEGSNDVSKYMDFLKKEIVNIR